MGTIPRVVVGVPTYNNADTVEATLKMVTRQTRLPDEIVICDKSSDETPDIVRRYAQESDVPIKLFIQEGDGVAAAYNQILRYVQPDYDIFATIQTNLTISDDWLETHIEIHKRHPKIGMVTGYCDGPDREVSRVSEYYYSGRNGSYKKGTLEMVSGWDDNFLRGEDWDMRIRLGCAGIRSYVCSEAGHGWLSERAELDPYITKSKAIRTPTSVTFLAKFGGWYLRFHPAHVIHDCLSLAMLSFIVSTAILLAVNPVLAVGSVVLLLGTALSYVVGHNKMQGSVDGSTVVRPLKKQLLTGFGVLYAICRVAARPEWNHIGFDADPTFVYDDLGRWITAQTRSQGTKS